MNTYELLEDKMLKYSDLADVPVLECGEPLVPLVATQNLEVNPIDPNMTNYTGDAIYVRETVTKKLGEVATKLAQLEDNLALEVVYGYRALSIQTDLFEKFRNELSAKYSGVELMEAVHRLVAVPNVAGHPTGGAVDVQFTKNGSPLSMGTKIWEFVPDAYTFSPYVGREGWSNRQLLRRYMTESGFAPFDGEWWHFSYGDKEWAKFYNKPSAIYAQVEFKI